MVDFSAVGQSKRAASVTTAAQAVGFTGGPAAGRCADAIRALAHASGLLAAVRPDRPAVHRGYGSLPRAAKLESAGELAGVRRRQPKSPAILAGLAWTFALAASAVTRRPIRMACWSCRSAGRSAAISSRSSNALVNGAALSLFAHHVGRGQDFGKESFVRGRPCCWARSPPLPAWACSPFPSPGRNCPIFLASTAIAGIGYNLLFLGGLALLGGAVPARHRGSVLSALYLFAYLSMGMVALGLGVVATERETGLAVDLGAAATTGLSLGTIGLLASSADARPKRRRSRRPPAKAAASQLAGINQTQGGSS